MQATRRAVLGAAGAAALAFPSAAFGHAPDQKRLLVVLLRGGMDGLAAVPPIGDPDYAAARGALAIENALPLDACFALHPSLPNLHAMYGAGELLCLHAIATPYRERSHFDAQNMLETGAHAPFARTEGWLGKTANRSRAALAIGAHTPPILRGGATIALIDPSESAFQTQARAAAYVMGGSNGRRIGVMEMSGWDAHANQTQTLARNFRDLDDGLAAFKADIGPLWRDTIVVVATEFGRTVAPNAAGGTDHGAGGAAFLLGGAVAGGRVLADWPGLSPGALYSRESLAATTDLRAVLKGVLADHLSIPTAALNRDIFPASERVRPTSGLLRA